MTDTRAAKPYIKSGVFATTGANKGMRVMPNRIIKESIRTSKKVNELSDFEFRVWLYLITYVDDYGRGSADAELLKGFVFPRRKGVTECQISDALTKLANIGMVNLYEVDGEPYFYFPKWSEHQRIQTKHPKFPNPPSLTVTHGDSPLESNPIQSNTNTESESKYESNSALFDAFWSAYPKKVGKADAKKVFEKVKVPLETLLSAIERQKCGSQWTKDNGQYIPNPATWLRQGRWEDEVYTAPTSGRRLTTDQDYERSKDIFGN